MNYLGKFPGMPFLIFAKILLIHLISFRSAYAQCHWLVSLGWDSPYMTGRVLTCCSDGTHLRGNSDPWRPASSNITAALHFGDGLWQLIRATAVCQSRVAVSWAHICRTKKHMYIHWDQAWDMVPLPQHLHASQWGCGRIDSHVCPLEGKLW
jgi:hypothetical protein